MISLSLAALLVIHNVMPAFWKAYSAPPAQRVAQVKQLVIMPNLAVYANGEFSNDLTDDAISSYLLMLEPKEQALRAKSAQIAQALPGAIASVQAGLPDLDLSKIQFWILPSFSHFNGQTTDVPHGTGVLFDADGVLQYGPQNFSVIVAHELFHIYQHQTHPGASSDTQSVWAASWNEGTAAYASQMLVKGATMTDALDETLVNTGAATTKSLACFIQKNWDSHSGHSISAMIVDGDHPDGMPTRGGYLIGYLAAKEFAASHTLAQIGSSPSDVAEAAMKTTATRLCPQ